MRALNLTADELELDDIAAAHEELLEAAMPWLRLLAEIRQGAAGSWKQYAACAGTSVDVFFVDRGVKLDDARALCDRCPVIEQCTNWALDAGPELHGYAAGTTRGERARLRSIDRAA